ncbi:MAG: DUF3078 domain-containing protein [Bacteroidia bacterium]|nr:DUF3078 domain-containing protein [Bacteroidia bacterium]
MIKKVLIIIWLFPVGILQAQNDTLWRNSGLFNLNFNQANFYQWAGGANNSVAVNGLVSVFAKYKKANWSWDNTGDFALGAVKQGQGGDWRKSDDKIDINSKLGYAIEKKLYFSALAGFKTQFTEGFVYNKDESRNRISNLLAPAYLIGSIGIDYKPNTDFSVFVSPITSRTIIVKDKTLSNAGAFGVKPGNTTLYEFGAYLTAKYKKNIMDNVFLGVGLDLFSNYLDNPQNVDLNLELLLTFKVNKFLQASFSSNIVYDDNTTVPVKMDNGDYRPGKGVQMKNVIGVGLAYKIQGFKTQSTK